MEVGDGLVNDGTELCCPENDGGLEAADNSGQDGRLAGTGNGLELAYKGHRPAARYVRTIGKVGDSGFNELGYSFLLEI